MNLTRLGATALLSSVVLVAAACGGDDEEETATPAAATAEATETTSVDASPDEAAADDDEAADDDDEAAADEAPAADAAAPGVAVLTIGDESWSFDGIFCAASPEEAGNDRISFGLSAFGTVDGSRVQLDATIQDTDEQGRMEGEGTIHSVTLNDVEDFENPALAWMAPSPFAQLSAPLITVDGKSVSAEGPFDDELTEEEFEEIPGSLSATCP